VTLLGLAGIIAISLIGPLVGVPRRFGVPIVVGELVVGVLLGNTGVRLIHPSDPILTFLAQAGFGLVMLVAGTHVPIGNRALRKAFGRGLILTVGIGIVAVPVAASLSSMAHTHHTALYAVLLASSSAAVIMPIVQDEGLTGDRVLTLMAQVAIADTACIIALPLAADPSKAGRAAVGAVIVLAVAGLGYLVLRELADRDLIARLQTISVRHNFGIEMRVSLAALFALAGLAVNVHVSVMLAGFAFGLALSAVGTPRRLASQLFAVTEGFLGPIFFIWLGASIDLRALTHHPRLVVLAIGLAAGSTVIHALGRFLGQPLPLATLAGAQLGVPVAAVALGAGNQLLAPGEGGAILGAAVLTLGVAAVSGAAARRYGSASSGSSRATTKSAASAAAATVAGPGDSPTTLPPRAREPAASAAPADRLSARAAEPPTQPTRPTPRAEVRAPVRPVPSRSRKTKPTPTEPTVHVRTSVPTTRADTEPAETALAHSEPAELADAAEPMAAATAQVRRPPPSGPPARQLTPNPATKPIVQSNVRIQPSPSASRAQQADRTDGTER
jgi:Kef-type K+ transport system membrane component KefB